MTSKTKYLKRLTSLRKKMKENETKAILITRPEDRRYLSGFKATDPQSDESSGSLLITIKEQWLLTDFRYEIAAENEAPDYKIVIYQGGAAEKIAQILQKNNIRELMVDEAHLNLAAAKQILKKNSNLSLNPLPSWILEARAVKDEEELTLLKKALEITEKALAKLWDVLKEGLTEKEAAVYLDRAFVDLGASGPSFDTIIASGPNGALPHAEPGDRKIQDNDLIVIDCGALYQGYAADITRTKIIGTAKNWQKEIYNITRQAQLAAIKYIKPGVSGKDVDAVARNIIEKAGYGKYFGHSLGHGVGLAVHEYPNLSPRSNQILKVGMITTIEPGIYLPQKGGVRLEQMVLITNDGGQVLNEDQHFYKWD